MAFAFENGAYTDGTGRTMLDPTVYQDWQIGAAAERALENGVFHEVGEAEVIGSLVASSHAHGHTHVAHGRTRRGRVQQREPGSGHPRGNSLITKPHRPSGHRP